MSKCLRCGAGNEWLQGSVTEANAPKAKSFRMWVLVDRRGRVWTYTDGTAVTFPSRSYATNEAAGLDKKREWKATRATLTVTGKP